MTYAEHLKKYVMEECSPQHVEKAVQILEWTLTSKRILQFIQVLEFVALLLVLKAGKKIRTLYMYGAANMGKTIICDRIKAIFHTINFIKDDEKFEVVDCSNLAKKVQMFVSDDIDKDAVFENMNGHKRKFLFEGVRFQPREMFKFGTTIQDFTCLLISNTIPEFVYSSQYDKFRNGITKPPLVECLNKPHNEDLVAIFCRVMFFEMERFEEAGDKVIDMRQICDQSFASLLLLIT